MQESCMIMFTKKQYLHALKFNKKPLECRVFREDKVFLRPYGDALHA